MAQNDWTPKLDAWLETKIGRLLWLHWYSKLFSMNLTRQTLPISFRFPSENTETPIFKRLVCRMGYAKFRHVSCWNSQCLWVYICHCFQSHWTPSIGCRSAIIFHNRPLSSIICHLPLFAIFIIFHAPHNPSSKKHIFWGFLTFYWLQRPFFTMFTTYLPPNHGRSVRRSMDRMPPTWAMKVVLRPMSLRVTKHCRPGNPKLLEHGCFL